MSRPTASPSSEAHRLHTELLGNAPFVALTISLPDLVFVLTEAGEIAYAGPSTRDVLSIAPDEVVGRRFLGMVHAEDRERLPDQMSEGRAGVHWEVRIRDGRGHWRWMSLSLRRPDAQIPGGPFVLMRPLGGDAQILDAAGLFQRALNAANNLVVVTDARRADNPIVFANQYFLDVTGYAEDEVLGENCRFLQFHSDGTRDEQPERDALRVAIEAGEYVQVLMRNYRKDGAMFWNELYVTPVFDSEGQLTHFVGVQNDVTERVEAQRDVAEREDLLRSFYDSAPVMMGVAALEDGRLVQRSANRSAAAFFGVTPEAVTGKTERELGFSEREAERWAGHYRTARASGAPVRFDTVHPWGASPDDDIRHLTVAVNHIAGSDASPLFSYVVEDVTERRRHERELQLVQQIIETTPAAFLVTERRLEAPGPRITYVNPAFTEMTGYTREEIVGQTPRILQGPKTDRALLNRLRRQLKAGRDFHGETVNYRKDGTEYTLNWSIAPICDASGEVRHWAATQRDVTEQRTLEQEVLEVSAREQERIAQDLHDGLGQLLTGASFMAANVERQLRAEGSPHADALARVTDIVQQAIGQARTIAHGLHPVNIESDGLMVALTHLAESVEEAFGIECTFSAEKPVLVTAPEKALHLYRIVQEAISNAVRHGQADVILIGLNPDPSGEEGRLGPVILTVQDDGTGVSDEALEEGGGMGFYTMRYRARRIGGSLEIGPHPDGGTVVQCVFEPDGAAP